MVGGTGFFSSLGDVAAVCGLYQGFGSQERYRSSGSRKTIMCASSSFHSRREDALGTPQIWERAGRMTVTEKSGREIQAAIRLANVLGMDIHKGVETQSSQKALQVAPLRSITLTSACAS